MPRFHISTDAKTGTTTTTPYTAQEEADADAAAAAAAAAATAAAAEAARTSSFKAEADRVTMVDRLRNATPQQMETFINNQVTDLASAKRVLIMFAKVLATVIRD